MFKPLSILLPKIEAIVTYDLYTNSHLLHITCCTSYCRHAGTWSSYTEQHKIPLLLVDQVDRKSFHKYADIPFKVAANAPYYQVQQSHVFFFKVRMLFTGQMVALQLSTVHYGVVASKQYAWKSHLLVSKDAFFSLSLLAKMPHVFNLNQSPIPQGPISLRYQRALSSQPTMIKYLSPLWSWTNSCLFVTLCSTIRVLYAEQLYNNLLHHQNLCMMQW